MTALFFDNEAGSVNGDARDNTGFGLLGPTALWAYDNTQRYLAWGGGGSPLSGYTFEYGDVVAILTVGVGGTLPGLYQIEDKINNDTVILKASADFPFVNGAPGSSGEQMTVGSGPYHDESAIGGAVAAGDVVWIRKTSTSYANGVVISTTGTLGSPIRILGYDRYPGDGGRPLLTKASGNAIGTSGNPSYYIMGWLEFLNVAGSAFRNDGSGDNFTMFASIIDACGSYGIVNSQDSTTLLDTIIRNCLSYPAYLGKYSLIDGCRVVDNSVGALLQNGSIVRSLLRGNGTGTSHYQATFTSSAGPYSVVQCTIIGAGTPGSYTKGIYGQSSPTLLVADSFIDKCSVGVDTTIYTHGVLDRVKFGGGVAIPYSSDCHVLRDAPTGDPEFIDETDYLLGQSSALLGAGMSGANIGWDQSRPMRYAGAATHAGLQL